MILISKHLNNIEKDKRTSYRMSKVRSKRTGIENKLAFLLWHSGIHYRRNYKKLMGSPDIVLTKRKIAIFCDGDFWHGYNWNNYKKTHFYHHRKYWIHKIEHNMKRDKKDNIWLKKHGWTVLRFWGHTIKRHPDYCLEIIKYYIRSKKSC